MNPNEPELPLSFRLIIAMLVIVTLDLGVTRQGPALSQWLFDRTGEEQPLAQLRGLGQLATDLIRPRLNLEPEVPIAYNGLNPYAVNTFLQQEVEPAKRAQQTQMISEAGFHWIRQEFPWYDLEVSSKGDFDDCRTPHCYSAWDKYDEIVNLADEYNLEIIARLSSPPDWSRTEPAEVRGAFAPPDNFSDFTDFAVAVAQRYQGRVRYYQIWNEPNIYPEWGNQPVDPEAYTQLLCQTYQRLKSVDPNIVVLSGVLAPTSELGGLNDEGGNNLNDYIFLQRMYAAGAKDCFDVLSVQGYGLWSGPTDHRARPLIVNYGRNRFIRDLMVANGDEHKAIWIAEMNWNAVPTGKGIAPNFGRVTEQQQAKYAPLAYQRAQEEWPWVGVNAFWFFKRADDSEKEQAWYYFRMAEPDFTLLPVYYSLQEYLNRTALMHPGWFQEDHWSVAWSEGWQLTPDDRAAFGWMRATDVANASVRFKFEGTDLALVVLRRPEAGTLSVIVDGGEGRSFNLHAESTQAPSTLFVAHNLHSGEHEVEIVNQTGLNAIDGFIVQRVPNRTALVGITLIALLAITWYTARRSRPIN